MINDANDPNTIFNRTHAIDEQIRKLEEENDKLKKENEKLVASSSRYYEAAGTLQKENDEWREAIEKFTDRFWKLKKADPTNPKLLFKAIADYITKLETKKAMWKQRAKALDRNYLAIDGDNIAVALHRISNINYYKKCYSGLGMAVIIEIEMEYKNKVVLEYDDVHMGMHIFHSLKADWEEYLARKEEENE